MSASLTPLAISVLAMLNERPMHPYEMYQLLLERHEDRIVKVRPGSLYHAVERLVDHELARATGTERCGNRPERTTYAITDSGQAILTDRIGEMLRSPVNEFPQFPLALSESHNLPRTAALDGLEQRSKELDAQITEVQTLIGDAQNREVPEAYWFAADYLCAMQSAERDWIRRLITRLESKELAWPLEPNR